MRKDIEQNDMANDRQEACNAGDDDDKASQRSESIPPWLATMCCATMPTKQEGDKQTQQQQQESVQPMTPEEIARDHAKLAQDDPGWAYLANLGAIGIIFICSFFWGYFA